MSAKVMEVYHATCNRCSFSRPFLERDKAEAAADEHNDGRCPAEGPKAIDLRVRRVAGDD